MSRQKESPGDRIFLFINDSLLLLAFIVVIYPLVNIVSNSFSSSSAVMAGRVWLYPVEPTLAGYRAVFNNPDILSGYANTFFYTFIGTAVNIFMTIIAAYPLSRKDFKPRNFIMLMFAFTMIFSGGLIPNYILISKLGLINTRAVMIIPGALSVRNVIVTRTYFENTIPNELLEVSHLDGCKDIKFILKIVIPLSSPIIAVMTLFYAVGHWNSYFQAFIYLSNRKFFPLQLVLREILILGEMDPSTMSSLNLKEMEVKEAYRTLIKYSVIFVSSAPILCMYPFIQKYFVKGIMIGSLKG